MKVLVDIDDKLYKEVKNPNIESGYNSNNCYDAIWKGIPIDDNATNGDMIKAMFPKAIKSNYIESSIDFEDYVEIYLGDYLMRVSYDWWNAPYKADNKNKQGLAYADQDTLMSAT